MIAIPIDILGRRNLIIFNQNNFIIKHEFLTKGLRTTGTAVPHAVVGAIIKEIVVIELGEALIS